jgi:hypothetical protein
VCSSNRLVARSGEIVGDRTTALGEDRQSPIIAAKTSPYRELYALVFHSAVAKETPT